ncbi:MAG: carboxylesterase/lipase family protein [Spirochaetes bacterium]|nr:carboxylesterase/lipase family protein [Spirochaetota bacterium]
MSGNLNTIVNTKNGKIEGSYEKDIFVFRGIPYAAPPLGKLRWMPPREPASWNNVRFAKSYAPIAPQILMPDDFLAAGEPEPQNEDCLYLNVWTPGLDNKRRPVMVWIHGGAFSMGSGSMITYRDSTLPLRGDVVLVTFNYRLGVLGFLNLNELSGGRIPSTGNEGLLDQIKALQWVKENIEKFGGDPSNVTVFGESAGGMSINCLMNMPNAQGLFHKAIIESSLGEIARPLKRSVEISEVFLEIAGLTASDESALRSLPVEQLLSAQQKLSIKTGLGIAPAIPAADGKILPMMPLESYEQGKAAKVPIIIGSNLEEQKLFMAMEMGPDFGKMDEAALLENIKLLVREEDAIMLIEGYKNSRMIRNEPVNPTEISCAIYTDALFRLRALQIAESHSKYGNPAYNYLFTWKSPFMNEMLGACHALEIGFIFGSLDPVFTGTGTDADILSVKMQDAWISFAAKSTPECKNIGGWAQYSDQKQTMIFGKDCHPEKEPYREEVMLWDSVKTVNLSGLT